MGGENVPKLTKKVREKKVYNINENYCRKCMKYKSPTQFYETTNPMLDANGVMSICKDCCNDIYNHYFGIYGTMEIALDLTCQDLDVRFSQESLKQCQSHVEKLLGQGKPANAVFGYYKSKLATTGKNNESIDVFRYKDSSSAKLKTHLSSEEKIKDEDCSDENIDLKMFWGDGFTSDDYEFLGTELENWQQTHKCDNQAEWTSLKEKSNKRLAIRKKRAKQQPTTTELKELQELMKTASVDPAKANVASAGKSHEAFGVWIKDIEQFRPAEWYEKQDKYKDMDGFVPYLKNYVVRPIENFLTGIRNFLVDDNIDVNLDGVDVGEDEGDNVG